MPNPELAKKRVREEDWSEEKKARLDEQEWESVNKYRQIKQDVKREKLKGLSDEQRKILFSYAVAIETQLAYWGLKPQSGKYEPCKKQLKRAYKQLFESKNVNKTSYKNSLKILETTAEKVMKDELKDEKIETPTNEKVKRRVKKIFISENPNTVLGEAYNDLRNAGLKESKPDLSKEIDAALDGLSSKWSMTKTIILGTVAVVLFHIFCVY